MDALEHDGAEAQAEIALSIEETNKLRLQLGLKPLDLEKSSHEKKAEANYNAVMEKNKRKKEVDAVNQRIEKSKNRQKLREKLIGVTLSAPEEHLDDAAEWIQRQKKMATQFAENVKDAESFVLADYNEKELEGVKVGHSMDRFEEGKEFILTLKDKGVLEDDADELENVDIRRVEGVEERAHALRGYTGYEEDDVVNVGQQRPLLSKYDALEKDSFMLAASGTVHVPSKASEGETKLAGAVDLHMEKMNLVQDFYTPEELVIKSSKKRKRPHSLRKKSSHPPSVPDPAESEDTLAATPVLQSNLSADVSSMNFVDDEDLQHTLMVSRTKARQHGSGSQRAATNVPGTTPLAYAPSLPAGDSLEPVVEGALVFDATSEFAHGIALSSFWNDQQLLVEQQDLSSDDRDDIASGPEDEVAHGAAMKRRKVLKSTDNELNDATEGSSAELADDDEEEEKKEESHKAHDGVAENETESSKEDGEEGNEWEPSHPLQDEPDLNLGVGAALELFRKRGHLAAPDQEKLAREKEYMERLEWGLAHPTSKDKSKSAMKARIKDQVSKFKDYKPSINLDYVDDFGNVLSTKDAYRQLSHRFHGRSSGKNKQEKLMRKEEERRRMLNMVGGDTPLQLASAMLQKQAELGTPGILLSIGSRPATNDPSGKK